MRESLEQGTNSTRSMRYVGAVLTGNRISIDRDAFAESAHTLNAGRFYFRSDNNDGAGKATAY